MLNLGWRPVFYDPFVYRAAQTDDLGKFDLITAVEVFEHPLDVKHLVSDLASLPTGDGVLQFSTLLSFVHL